MIRTSRTDKNFVAEESFATTAAASLNRILKKISAEGLSKDASIELTDDIKLVSERFGISPKAAVLLALILEKTNSSNYCDDEDLADYVGCTNIEFFGFHDAVQELIDKGVTSKSGGRRSSYRVTVEAMKVVENDSSFEPVKTVDLTTDEVFTRFRRLVLALRNEVIDVFRFHDEIVDLIDKNQQLLFCRKVAESPIFSNECTDTERRYFFYLCHRYVSFGNPSVSIDTLMNLNEPMEDDQRIRRNLANEKSGLQRTGMAGFAINDGYASTTELSLSDKVKATFFDEIQLAPEEKVNHKDLISWESINDEELFYNEAEGKAIERLEDILEEENFKTVQKRMEEQGMQKGFSCVFHGCAGSGKTATLKALARRTKRDLFWVDLSALKSKWVGESEKQVKALFDTYRNLVRTSERCPILAVNEADAIFTKRITNIDSSTDQMNNAITDIILNELETLNGILIATTNLVGNMMDAKDNAMERRFLFKIEFKAPEEGVREKIWKSKLPHLTDEEAKALATGYKLSGGNIDNVARKSVMDYVLTGTHADLPTLRKYCEDETVRKKKEVKKIGF